MTEENTNASQSSSRRQSAGQVTELQPGTAKLSLISWVPSEAQENSAFPLSHSKLGLGSCKLRSKPSGNHFYLPACLGNISICVFEDVQKASLQSFLFADHLACQCQCSCWSTSGTPLCLVLHPTDASRPIWECALCLWLLRSAELAQLELHRQPVNIRA